MTVAVASANNEIDTGRLQAFAEDLPFFQTRNDAKMMHRYGLTINDLRRRLAQSHQQNAYCR